VGHLSVILSSPLTLPQNRDDALRSLRGGAAAASSTRGLSRARSAQAVCERWKGRIHHPRHRMLFPIVAIVAVAFVIFFFLVENLSIADIYDIVIVRMTRVWYAAVLDRLEPNSRLLDVGIGTATALVSGKNKSVIIDKQLKIIGIDYEAAYVKKASFVCQQAGLSQQVKVYCQSIYDDKLHGLFSTERERFDAAYFSGSITLMPDPAEALKCAARMLKPGGVIYVTQTFQNRPSPFMEWLKPRLHKLTTIDFGRVTYHTEVAQIVRKAGMVIAEDAPVPGSINNANQTARMLVVKQIFSGSVLNTYNSQDMRSV
jgi:ubiquinone/menaquinone biosynthesis C-methylase UbiE